MSNQEIRKRKRARRSKFPLLVLVMVFFVGVAGYIFHQTVYQDLTAIPDITLNGEATETIEVFAEYTDPGATATIRGEAPNKAITVEGTVDTSKPGEYLINYKITNNKGRKETTVTRKITVIDDIPPTIELNGDSTVTVKLGGDYKEAGATATDNYDGDISGNVEITGEIDFKVVGDYKILYSVSDSSGNKTEVERTVRVQGYKPGNNMIFLTFDDGPSRMTPKVLDLLKQYNAKATFFLIGSELTKYKDLVKRMQDEGHTIALHSNTHNYKKIYASDEAFWKDMETLSKRVEEITGEKSRLIRFPGGTSNTVSRKYSPGIMTRLEKQAHEKGYLVYDWTISSADASGHNVAASKISNSVIKGMKNSRSPKIALMHDAGGKQTTVDALSAILDYGNKNGYIFAAMDETVPEYIMKPNN